MECEMTTMHCGNITQGLRKEEVGSLEIKAWQCFLLVVKTFFSGFCWDNHSPLIEKCYSNFLTVKHYIIVCVPYVSHCRCITCGFFRFLSCTVPQWQITFHQPQTPVITPPPPVTPACSISCRVMPVIRYSLSDWEEELTVCVNVYLIRSLNIKNTLPCSDSLFTYRHPTFLTS